MNKTNLFFALVFLSSFHALAQKEITVLTNSKAVGHNLLTGEPVQAKEYIFPERVHDFQIDASGKKVAEFSASSRSTFLNGKLYNAQEMSFLEINRKTY